MKHLTLIHPLAAIAALALVAATATGAEETANTAKFSDPSKPGTLKVVLARGDVHIEGGTGQEVVVKSEMQPHQKKPRKDGLRVLTESSTYSLTEKDNVITLDASSDGIMGSPSDFTITVPRGTNVAILNSLGGDTSCASISGDIEIKSLHGDIRLADITGGAVVDTLNGEITASVRELTNGKALSFSSLNGEVKIQVPPSAKANIRLRTQNGTILTDFDDKTLVTKVENLPGMRHGTHSSISAEAREAFREAARAGAIAAQHAAAAVREAAEAAREGAEEEMDDGGKHAAKHVAPVPPVPPVLPSIPPISGGKQVAGTLNGGGPEINVTTMNGDITLRQLAAK